MNTGKKVRMRNIFGEERKSLIIAVDHAAIAGGMGFIQCPEKIISTMSSSGADAFLLTKGMLVGAQDVIKRGKGLIYRISGGFTLLTDPAVFEDRIISSVEAGIRLGADAMALIIKYGHEKEGEFIERASNVADICEKWGMPLMIEVMVKGNRVEKLGLDYSLEIACRAAYEIGADFIKTSYPQTDDGFKRMVDNCPVPLVILGGEKKDSAEDFFKMIKNSIDLGGGGVALGRNIWSHEYPEKMMKATKGIVYENYSVEKALKCLQ
jgi:fructose-bisphosphate aldolase / 2-amino-3,7-dideoxy-D-threo-hept-6-ulosonate synthase